MTDLELIAEVAEEAGSLAMRYFRGSLDHWDKSPDNPVSEADIAVDDLIKARLLKARPDYGWLSEETEDDGARLDARRLFVVDPIDGTRAFIAGKPHFAVSIAIVDGHEAVAGVVYNPAADEFYKAEAGEGATLNGKRIRVGTRTSFEGAAMLGTADFFASRKVWPTPWPPMTCAKFNSIAWRFALVAAGRWDCAITLRPKCDWDIAAADIILREAGAVLITEQGTRPRYNQMLPEHPFLIAANSDLAADALERVRAARDHWDR